MVRLQLKNILNQHRLTRRRIYCQLQYFVIKGVRGTYLERRGRLLVSQKQNMLRVSIGCQMLFKGRFVFSSCLTEARLLTLQGS
jgi:hypothetical protein